MEHVSLFSTLLTHADRSMVVIPNRKIVGEILHNYGQIRQVSVQVGVAPDTDVAAALQIIEAVVLANPRVLKDVPPVIGVSSLAGSVVQISILPWVSVDDYGPATAEIARTTLEALRAQADQSRCCRATRCGCSTRVLNGSRLSGRPLWRRPQSAPRPTSRRAHDRCRA